jgi:predicted kinase
MATLSLLHQPRCNFLYEWALAVEFIQENSMSITLNPHTPRLILFAGHSGTGKSTLAKKALPLIIEKSGLGFFFLDKDTAYGQFSSHVMDLNTGDPDDRDSPYYLENLRQYEYAGLLAIARENLELGVNVILVGPFSREIQSGNIFQPEILGFPKDTSIRIAWIELAQDEARRRIQKRGDPKDQWKLNHWDEYIQRRIEPPVHASIERYENLEFDEQQFSKLIDHLID